MTHLGEELTDFVFGELPASEMEEARRHVAACADCRKQVEQFEGTRSLLKMAPDPEPPRHIVFEFEKRRSIWTWLVPAAVAAVLLVAVLLAPPMQFQWNGSQLVITVGNGFTPARADMKPARAPLQAAPAPTAQPIDYDRIAKQVENSQKAWLVEQLNKRDAEQLRQMRLLQGNVVYLREQQQAIARDNAENAANIGIIAQKSGVQ